MATTIHSATTSNGYTLYLKLTETATSTASNSSTVSWQLYLTSGDWNFSQYRVGWSVSLNGSVVSSKTKAGAPQVSITKHGTLTVAEGTATITHDADGRKTMTAAASIDMDTVSYTPGPMSLSGSMTLTAIPRASTLTVANGTLGVAQTITVNRASTSFTHTLTYRIGSNAAVTIATGVGASTTWTPPLTLMQYAVDGKVSAKITVETFSGGASIGTNSVTITLNSPALSKLTVASGTLGTAQTLTITRASTDFSHTLTYVCGSYSSSIGMSEFSGSGNTLTRSWTPLLSLAAQNTTGQTVSVTLTLTTLNGSTVLGTDVKTVTMTIPDSVRPSCSASVALVNDNATVAGWGIAVQGFSKYKVTTTFDNTDSQGSTFKRRTVKIDATGQTLTASPATSAVLASTTRTVKVQVTDSRDRVSSTVTVTGPKIYAYSTPTISAAEAFRCDSGGTADESGTYLSVKCKGSVSSCNGNNVRTIQWRRRVSGGSWSSWATLTNNTATVANAGLSASSSYAVQFRVTDSLGGSRTVEVTIPTASVTLNLRRGGTGAAFGKYAEADGELQVAWDLKLTTPLEVASGGTGQTTAYTSVTVTPDTTSGASDHAIGVRLYPYLAACWCRGYVKISGVAIAANTWITVATVGAAAQPSASYPTPLAVNNTVGGEARVTASGELQVRFYSEVPATATRYMYFAGWWTV